MRHKNVVVAHVLAHTEPNIQFRRSLVGDKWAAWLHLVERLMEVFYRWIQILTTGNESRRG